jgi:hypothetical protein
MIKQIAVTPKTTKRPQPANRQHKSKCKPKAALEPPTTVQQALLEATNGDQEAALFLEVCAPDVIDDYVEDTQDLLADALNWWMEPE